MKQTNLSDRVKWSDELVCGKEFECVVRFLMHGIYFFFDAEKQQTMTKQKSETKPKQEKEYKKTRQLLFVVVFLITLPLEDEKIYQKKLGSIKS